MWTKVGLLRTEAGLTDALMRVREMRRDDLALLAPPAVSGFNMELQGCFDLRAALLTAESVIVAALNRRETRGAHQREDFPAADRAQAKNQIVRLRGADPELVT
jgi:succinate dehydrogenase/fumarate reductase flavoprotein subunit